MAVQPSIFVTIKDKLDIAPDDDSFDSKVLGFINGVLSDLVDLGIGPPEGFAIEDDGDEWIDLLGDYADLNRVQNWVYLKVKQLFDPAQNSFQMANEQKIVDELTWRLINKEDREREVITS